MRRIKTIILMFALLLGACSRDPQTYVEIGKRLSKAGKEEEAALNFGKAIQKNANFAEAYYRLGMSQTRLGKKRDGLINLAEAVRLSPQNETYKVEFAVSLWDTILASQPTPKVLYDRLSALAQDLVENHPKSIHGYLMTGYMAVLDQKTAEAAVHFRKAYGIDPANRDAALALLQSLIKTNDSDEAERIGLKLIKDHPQFGLGYDVLARRYVSSKRASDAEHILETKVANIPKQSAYILQLAAYYAAAGKNDKMKALLDRVAGNPKDYPNGVVEVGDFYTRLRKYENALQVYTAAVAAHPSDRNLYKRKIAIVLALENKRAEAIESLTELLKESPGDTSSVALRASLLIETGVRADIEAAVADLKRLVSGKPKDGHLRFQLGRAYWAQNNLTAAKTEMLEAVKQRSNHLQSLFALAELNRATGDYGQVVRYCNNILARDPGATQIRLLRTVGLMGIGKNEEARVELVNLQRRRPGERNIELQLGLLNLAQNRLKEAELLFQRHFRPRDKDLRPLEGLVEVYLARKQFAKALDLIQSERTRDPESVPFQQLWGNAALKAGKHDIALDTFKRLASRDPRNVDHQLRIGETCRLQNDLNCAVAAFRKAQELASPGDTRAHGPLSYLLAASGSMDQSEQTYRALLAKQPDNVFALNNLAYLLADRGQNLDEALKLATRAQQKAPSEPEISDTIGCIYLKKGMIGTALQVFGNLVRTRPDNPLYRLHHAEALSKAGDTTKAKTELQSALQARPAKEVEAKIKELMARIG